MSADLVITGCVMADMGPPVDVTLSQGRIVAIEPARSATSGSIAHRTLNGEGALLLPGFVDIQVHFRTPGAQHSEDIESGSAAAASGGVTACVMMPNTDPPIDSIEMVRTVLGLAADARCDVRTSACVSVGRAGERAVDFAALHALGVRVFTDDGDAVAEPELMRAALVATTNLPGAVISQHAEDPNLIAGGVINAGRVAEQLGVAGRPAEAEERIVARDLHLCKQTGGRYHVLHLSTAASLAHVAKAKSQGVRVTAEVTPQHLALTEDDVPRLGTDGKMNPPLRLANDVAALRLGLVSGALDAVATDHAPHHPSLKDCSLAQAAPGMLGVETMSAVLWTELVASGEMSLARFVEVTSTTPARIAGITEHGRPVAVGEPANLVVFDPAQTWTVDRNGLHSRSVNTPWHGRELTGRARHTILAGVPVMADGQLR